jgi:uncharacterized membrane protein YeaQ/YmgE (transglycosylase-associated protein family)
MSMHMHLFALLVFGLITGFISSKLINRRGEGLLVDIFLGLVGAIVGSFIFHELGYRGVTGFNLWSMMVAVAGGVLLLVVFHALRRITS